MFKSTWSKPKRELCCRTTKYQKPWRNPKPQKNLEKPRKGEESKGTKEGSKHAQKPLDL